MPNRDDYIRLAASQSFTEAEVRLLDQLFRALVRGGDPRDLARRTPFASLYGKVTRMRKRIEAQRREKTLSEGNDAD